MTDIITIQNVRGYLDANNTAWLNAEDVARKLGWAQFKNGVEYIRWETVNKYLAEFDFPKKVGKDDFIPENMLYRLVWKSRDEKALEFQSKVTDEILPAIRKHGVYATEGYAHLKTARVNGRTVTYLAWTQRGRYFLYQLLKEHGILPVHIRLKSAQGA